MTDQNLISEYSDADCSSTGSRGATGLSRAAVQCLVGLVAVLVLAGGVAAMSNGGQRPTIGSRGEESQPGASEESPERIAAELAARNTATGSPDTGNDQVSGNSDGDSSLSANEAGALQGRVGGVGASASVASRSTDTSVGFSTGDAYEFGDAMADVTDKASQQLSGASNGAAPGNSTVTNSVVNQPAAGGTTATPNPVIVTTNATPTLPVRTIDVQIPVGKKVELFSDSTLAAGWSDPDNTADWLCLTFTPERRDFWLDGADCEGKGLWAQVSVAGTYVINVRVREATTQFPAGVGPQSDQGVTLRLIAS